MSLWGLFWLVPASFVFGAAFCIGMFRLTSWVNTPGRLPRFNRFMNWAIGWKDEPL